MIAQVSFHKDFNGYEKKIERYNYMINNLNENLVWWMSLNRTEKNNREQVCRLILDSENLIVEEIRKWLATSQAIRVDKKDKNTEKSNNEENKNNNKDEEVDMKK